MLFLCVRLCLFVSVCLCALQENEHEASRRLKTEFMVQLDGAASRASDRILICE